MSKDVYKAYETYFRGEEGNLVETGKHVLLPGLPDVGTVLNFRRNPEPRSWKVLAIEEDRKIVVEEAS
jgi:hypothetical protein